jgi:hypothetical protein
VAQNPRDSSPSESSASYVDPDNAGKTKGDSTKNTPPNTNNLEVQTIIDPNTTDETGGETNQAQPDAVIESAEDIGEGNSQVEVPLEEGTPQVEVPSDDISGDTSEIFISGDGIDEENFGTGKLLPPATLTNDPLLREFTDAANQTAMVRGETLPTLPTLPEGWTTVMDKKTKRKNKKACKNKEKQQKKQAKLLRYQARHGPVWAHQGGVLPSSLGSASGSPRHSSSDLNQNSQLHKILEEGSNLNGSPGGQGERSNTESRADSQHDPNLSGGSQ